MKSKKHGRRSGTRDIDANVDGSSGRTDIRDTAYPRLLVGTLTERKTRGESRGNTDGGSPRKDANPASIRQSETTPTGSLGLYSISFSPKSGFACVDHTVMSNPNPSFLAKRGHLLIAAHEVADKAKAAVYSAHDDGSIEHLSTIADKSGAECCHVALHPNGRWVYGANRESGSLGCWPLRLDNSLGPLHAHIQHEGHGPNLCRQKSPHIRSSTFVGVGTPRMPILAVSDLGTDTVTLYEAPANDGIRLDPYATIYMPAGFGPRMVAPRPHHPGQLAIVGELANSVIIYNANPGETQASRSIESATRNARCREQYDFGIADIPIGRVWQELTRFDLPSCCGIRSLATHAEFSPCGRWLYVSICGKNAIAVYELDEKARVISQAHFPCGGSSPQHFSVSPCGSYLAIANRESDNIVVFYAPKTSDEEICEICRIEIPSPTCVIWD